MITMNTFIGLSPASLLKPSIKKSLALTLLLSSATNSYGALLTGELIISEVMANPAAVSDTNGEWFELYNSTDSTIDLNGLNFYDSGSNNHTINEPLFIEASSYLVLGRNNDTGANGGLVVDYVYSNFTLGNTRDDIFIGFMGTQLAALSYDSDGVFGAAGISAQWLGSGYGLTPGSFSYGAGDIGTPGSQGSYDIPPVAAVPIPASGWLLASGLCSLLIGKTRRKQA
jgi:hypothetical protein